MNLPNAFINRMKALLGPDFDSYIAQYENEAFKGIRVNTLKADIDKVQKNIGLELEKAPFSVNSYYINEKVGKMPAFHAGMFYAQEPSAASAVTLLDVQKGEKVLDLCAAPGGKSTQAAQALDGTGILWANEIVKNRANVLLSNIERMGIKNAVVSCEHPETLCSALRGYFNKVLVDAPCSGEGMFRKEPEALSGWDEAYPSKCAARQREILRSAEKAVGSYGELVYSTCTFSVEENEDIIKWFLKEYPDFELVDVNEPFGRPGIDGIGVRIYPIDGGEGHFAAKLRRKGENPNRAGAYIYNKEDAVIKQAKELYSQCFKNSNSITLGKAGDKILVLPEGLPDIKPVHVLRAGLLLGEIKGKNIMPCHSVFMASKPEEANNVINIMADDKRLPAFLHGEEIDSDQKGYTLVALDGAAIGFGKSSGGRLKNKYPKGLRF